MSAAKWPLAISNFTLWDKLKVCKWLLTKDQWTQGAEVRAYEKRWEKYTGAPHVIMVANGSVANELIALRRKHELQGMGVWPAKNKVIFPVVNWISSISPWVNLGFEPIFMDVGYNLCSSSIHVSQAIKKAGAGNVAAVFYTSLLGLTGGVEDLMHICDKEGVKFYLDNCEASFTKELMTEPGDWQQFHRHICNVVTSSTSLYFSHHTSGNQEGGLIFCQDEEENEWYRMARNHGMTRGMPDQYKNSLVDPSFDFHLMGSNYRSTNLLAYMCSLDFDRALEFAHERQCISEEFSYGLDRTKFEVPHGILRESIPLSIPIVVRPSQVGLLDRVKGYLKANGVEYRPIVGGNLLYQTAFKQYGNPKDFPYADYIHNFGLYVGLHTGVTRKAAVNLAQELSKL